MIIKRSIHRLGALAALMLSSPVLLAVAIAIRFDSRGPTVFRQKRIGRGSKVGMDCKIVMHTPRQLVRKGSC